MNTFTTTDTAGRYTATGDHRYTDGNEASTAAAAFPKTTRVGVYRATETNGTPYYYLRFDAKLAADQANGGTNEAGLRRLAAFQKAAAKLGYTLTPAS